MKSNHDEIRENLPEYTRSGDIPDNVREHLSICRECREEFSLLQELNKMQVPEPNGLFFETLPQKIRVSVKQPGKKWFSRLVPAFASVCLVIIAAYAFLTLGTGPVDEGLEFIDPFAPEIYDLSGINAEDIQPIEETFSGDEIYLAEEETLYTEFAYLSDEEIEALYEALGNEQNGGVL
jgi:hypothetical protein